MVMKSKKNSLGNIKPQEKYSLIEEAHKVENLGADADHSSESDYQSLNHDNDMISGNPEGESDQKLVSKEEGHSPLKDK